MQWYLISSFIVIVYCLQQYCLAQSTTVRPYKFGFTIEEQQHRYEKRDERGIVMGEFGFITADGIYHVTVYATDEQGRFRILAMKNYPYESPPKSVEVLVKPKIAVTTTTTQKPDLAKNNFYSEGCAGCFLKNGKNKPKGSNDDTNVKIDIRTLAQELPDSTNDVTKRPSLGQGSSSGLGKIKGKLSTPALLTPTFNSNINTKNILQNTKNIQSQTNSLTPHQQHRIEQTQTTLSSKNFDNLKTNQDARTSPQQFPKSNIVIKPNKLSDTTKSVTQSLPNPLKTKENTLLEKPYRQSNFKDILNTAEMVHILTENAEQAKNSPTSSDTTKSVTQSLPNPLKTKENTLLEKPYIQSDFKDFLNTAEMVHIPTDNAGQAKNTAMKHTQTPTIIAQQNTTPIVRNSGGYKDAALTTTTNQYTGNKATKYTPTQITLNPLETKKNIIGNKPFLQNDFQHNEILNSAQTEHVPIIGTTTAIRYTQAPKTNAPQNTTPPKHSNEAHSIEATTNKYTGNILVKITQTTTPTTAEKSYTTAASVTSKDTNPITPKSPKSNTPMSANSPAIMDIIMGKVLPTLMAKKGINSATTPNGNAKPNVAPSNNKAGNTKTSLPTAGNPATGKSAFNSNTNKGNSQSNVVVNGDGDLYRFKYILDYHGHSETGKRNGNKVGNYFAIGDDNVERTVEYVANENGFQPHIRWRKLNANEIKSKENTLKDYEFVWLTQ